MQRQPRVLIVDDLEDNRSVLRDLLVLRGFDVVLAEDGRAGFAKSQENPPDIILMDLQMPDMLGVDVCRLVRDSPKTKDVPIIMITGSNVSSRDKVWGFRSGADDYLVRPFETEELVERIKSVLRRREPAAAPVSLSPTSPLDLAPQPPVAAPFVPDSPPQSPAPAEPETFNWRLVPSLAAEVLAQPGQYWRQLDQWPSPPVMAVVIAAPLLASLSGVLQGSGGFGGWLASFALEAAAALLTWAALSALSYLVMPFLGADLSWKTVSAAIGASSVPKALAALLTVVYVLLAALNPAATSHGFSTGLDLFLPQQPASKPLAYLSRVGLIDIWGAWLAVLALSGLARIGTSGKVKLALTVGLAYLMFGLLTAY